MPCFSIRETPTTTWELSVWERNRIVTGWGARIAVEVIDDDGKRRQIHRAVGAVSSFGGSPMRQEIGLGKAARILSVSVQWPTSGSSQTFTEVPLDSVIVITEGESAYRVLRRRPLMF